MRTGQIKLKFKSCTICWVKMLPNLNLECSYFPLMYETHNTVYRINYSNSIKTNFTI